VLSIVLLQRLGASTVVAFVVAGQMLGALAFDQFGVMGLERMPATVDFRATHSLRLHPPKQIKHKVAIWPNNALFHTHAFVGTNLNKDV
jgi:Putative inner membrane exporter, YdcZ